jgi:hypothetical protein
MSEQNDERIRESLRKSIAPAADRELKRDLWPQMLRRLDERSLRVPWFDWALVVLLAALFAIFPGVIPVLLYHL